MARHAVKYLAPKTRTFNSRQAEKICGRHAEISDLGKATGHIMHRSNADRLGIYLSMLLRTAVGQGVHLSFQSMDDFIKREGHNSYTWAKWMLAMCSSQWGLKVELNNEAKEEEKRVWLQNMFNATGLMAARLKLDPIVDCLEPLLRSLQK